MDVDASALAGVRAPRLPRGVLRPLLMMGTAHVIVSHLVPAPFQNM